MQATISEAAGGGLKSVFLKIVDPLFRKKGAGAVLPIRVEVPSIRSSDWTWAESLEK
jgi:hypothetical protein